MSPASVLQLQRTAGNQAVTRLLTISTQRAPGSIQRTLSDQPQHQTAPQPPDAGALVAQHGAAVTALRARAAQLTHAADGPEKTEAGQLSGLLVETEALQTRIRTDAHQLETSVELETSAPAASTGAVEVTAEELGGEEEVDQPRQSPSVAIQRVKIKRHDRDYWKRVKSLSAKMKKTKLAVGGTQYTDFRTARRKAKLYAAKLDKNRAADKLKYHAYISKKTNAPHPTWQILTYAVKMNKYLGQLGTVKEHVRWFQHVNAKGYTLRSMRARLQPGKKHLMTGSNTAGTSELYWGEPILKARKGSRNSALYIKGHLLNDHLGGAGLAHNLVPLTADKLRGSKNKTGSNDANGEHNKQIEEPIKKLLTGTGQIKSTLSYRVDALPPNPDAHRINQTGLVKKYAKAFETAAKDPKNQNCTSAQIRDLVAATDPTLAGIGQPLLTAIGSGHLKPPKQAAELLLENASLWETENKVIPAGIECSAYYEQAGTLKRPTTKSGAPMDKFKIFNVLPTKYTAPYQP